MVNKDFCLSSYMAFRYIWKDGVDFAEGFQHKNFRPVEDRNRVPVRTSEDIDQEEGPSRPEFRKDIPMNQLTGNQRWQLWCAQQFLNSI